MYTPGSTNIAAWKMDPENGDIPASYVSLPKGVSFCGMNGHQVMFFSEQICTSCL